jgi:hypothetical protein
VTEFLGGRTPLEAKRNQLYRRRFGGARSIFYTGGASGIEVSLAMFYGSVGIVQLRKRRVK